MHFRVSSRNWPNDLHRSIRQCLKRISLEERVSNRLNSAKIELVGETSPDGVGVR